MNKMSSDLDELNHMRVLDQYNGLIRDPGALFEAFERFHVVVTQNDIPRSERARIFKEGLLSKVRYPDPEYLSVMHLQTHYMAEACRDVPLERDISNTEFAILAVQTKGFLRVPYFDPHDKNGSRNRIVAIPVTLAGCIGWDFRSPLIRCLYDVTHAGKYLSGSAFSIVVRPNDIITYIDPAQSITRTDISLFGAPLHTEEAPASNHALSKFIWVLTAEEMAEKEKEGITYVS